MSLLLNLLFAGSVAAVEGPFVETRAWALAEPVPIKAYAQDWDAPLQSGSDGFALLEAETGWQQGPWRIGWVWQRQYGLRASRDTAVLYHLSKNEAAATPGREYQLQLRAQTYEARGLRVGHAWAFAPTATQSLSLQPSLTVWRGDLHEDGGLRGVAVADANGELDYAADLQHFYSVDPLLDRRIDRPRGEGASLDLLAQWQWRDQWSVALDARNLLGRIWWSEAPFTLGTLQSNTRQTDSQGNVSFQPSLSGFEGQASHRQRLPLFMELALRYHWSQQALEARVFHSEIGQQLALGWLRETTVGTISGHWLPAQQALGVGYSWRGLKLQWIADDWKLERAHHLQLRLGGSWSF